MTLSGGLDHSAADRPRWQGDPDAVGTVAVVGLGKIGLPLAAQYSAAGWHVIGVDVIADVVDAVNAGRSHLVDEPGVPELLAEAHRAGRLEATLSHAEAAGRADVVVMIVPLMLTDEDEPDYAWMDTATEAVAGGIRPGTLVTYETTLPVGDTRTRYAGLIESVSGLAPDGGEEGFYLAFSPERVFSGRVLTDLSTYPKLVGGLNAPGAQRAMAFYRSVLQADVWDLGSSEAAEFAKLAETTYRDVNIALANEFARYADQIGGVDILEVIRGANSQPFAHIHQPGIGVGGHCIPVYPHFLLSRYPMSSLVRASRMVNDDQVAVAVDAVERRVGSLEGAAVLVLGLTYRDQVKELAYSRGPALVTELLKRGAQVSACDPLLDDDEIRALGAEPYAWADPSDAVVVMTQTADQRWADLDADGFPELSLLFDGRNSLRALELPTRVTYLGVGFRD